MPTPRRESAVGPIPCSSFVLERKLLRAYEQLYQQQIASIWHPATRLAAQVAALGGLDRAANRKGYAEARLREAMPELIQRLTLEQQPALAALLLTDEPDLGAVVAQLVKFERNLNYRDDDPRLSINDDGRLKASGLGRLSQWQYERSKPKYLFGPPLVLTPWAPTLRTKQKPTRGPRPATRKVRRLGKQLTLEFPGGGVTLASL